MKSPLTTTNPKSLGAVYLGDSRTHFCVWAPFSHSVKLHLWGKEEKLVNLELTDEGYHEITLDHTQPTDRYKYQLANGHEFPDPASRYQPEGVHGASQIIDPNFSWSDHDWHNMPLEDYIIYELHVGTFTQDGTLTSIIPYIAQLADLGITAIEIMPVSQFPGFRNWGYDGVYPFAVQHSYGGPTALKQLVNHCHQHQMAVILDVVYNHMGPEGNYFSRFGPYFTKKYQTPWGGAINFDDVDNQHVRHYFVSNALYWLEECHIDALRLDAVHAIYDHSDDHFLRQLSDKVHQKAKEKKHHFYLIAESDLNDPRLIEDPIKGGYGLDAQWNDDFHHALHCILSQENRGYYRDFGDLKDLAKSLQSGYVYTGQYSKFRGKQHGLSSEHIAANKFVIYDQSHDQIGNRALGDRLHALVNFSQQKIAISLVMLSPYIPMLFMGEEYGETAPFLYFIDHTDHALIEAVRQGRRKEFQDFEWGDGLEDPKDLQTFMQCKLNHELKKSAYHKTLYHYYKHLIQLRKQHVLIKKLNSKDQTIFYSETEKTMKIIKMNSSGKLMYLINFSDKPENVKWDIENINWSLVVDSESENWQFSSQKFQDSNTSDFLSKRTLLPYQFLLYSHEK